MTQQKIEGILPVNKESGYSSFFLVKILRKLTQVKKIGHAGTLDPLADGVMILLIGKNYTRLSDQFMQSDKEYLAKLRLGIETDTYDAEGRELTTSPNQPNESEVHQALQQFQGKVLQVPPMFSAKKLQGKKLYELARKGKAVERTPVEITLKTECISFEYPFLTLKIQCSKGTYIRSIAHDLGKKLNCGAHLASLTRTRSGSFVLDNCIDQKNLSLETIHAKIQKNSIGRNLQI